MKAKGIFLLAAALLLASCTSVYRKNADGVTVKVQNPVEGGPRLVRLEVSGDKIIRVSATPERRFADPQSLVIVPQQSAPEFTISENDGILVLKTSELAAEVTLATGEVRFVDKEGKNPTFLHYYIYYTKPSLFVRASHVLILFLLYLLLYVAVL